MAPTSSQRSVVPRYLIEQHRSALEKRVAGRFGQAITLRLNENRYTYFSARFPRNEPVRVSLHRYFADAPDEVVDAIVKMIRGKNPRAERVCHDYVARKDEERGKQPLALSPGDRRTRGSHHDLTEIARAVNERYFDGKLDVRVTWGRNTSAKGRRRSIRFGSYDHALDLVRIHPRLDSPEVPRFYLDYLLYHEFLHKALGEKRCERSGRRRVHHEEFLRREREHPQYEAAAAWEKAFFRKLSTGKEMNEVFGDIPDSEPQTTSTTPEEEPEDGQLLLFGDIEETLS